MCLSYAIFVIGFMLSWIFIAYLPIYWALVTIFARHSSLDDFCLLWGLPLTFGLLHWAAAASEALFRSFSCLLHPAWIFLVLWNLPGLLIVLGIDFILLPDFSRESEFGNISHFYLFIGLSLDCCNIFAELLNNSQWGIWSTQLSFGSLSNTRSKTYSPIKRPYGIVMCNANIWKSKKCYCYIEGVKWTV